MSKILISWYAFNNDFTMEQLGARKRRHKEIDETGPTFNVHRYFGDEYEKHILLCIFHFNLVRSFFCYIPSVGIAIHNKMVTVYSLFSIFFSLTSPSLFFSSSSSSSFVVTDVLPRERDHIFSSRGRSSTRHLGSRYDRSCRRCLARSGSLKTLRSQAIRHSRLCERLCLN